MRIIASTDMSFKQDVINLSYIFVQDKMDFLKKGEKNIRENHIVLNRQEL